jgi:hypothetical protein
MESRSEYSFYSLPTWKLHIYLKHIHISKHNARDSTLFPSRTTPDTSQQHFPPLATHHIHTTRAAPQGTSWSHPLHQRRAHITAPKKEREVETHHRLGNAPLISFPNCDKNISSLFSCSGPLYMWKSFLYTSISIILLQPSKIVQKIEDQKESKA